MDIRILDLDGAMLTQSELCARYRPQVVSLSNWGPRIRLVCGFRRFRRFQQALDAALSKEPHITFYGSGDFHHVSLALLEQVRQPINLLVLDNHPDWMRGMPFLHCGTWLYHAARLPQVRRIFHVGGDVDFDSAYRHLAPWRLLRSGKIVVVPARRRYQAGGWARVPHQPVRHFPQALLRPALLRDQLIPYRAELASLPLYISLDKDVLVASDAVVNWDSGHLTLDEVHDILVCFLTAADGRLAGMDVVGDWSPVRVRTLLGWLFHLGMHSVPRPDADAAAAINTLTNLALLETVLPLVREAERVAA
jgi:hypothetical protein